MAIDRAAILKNAEKLLRQGKIEPAIAEYLRVVEDQPRDWNLANTLGDLYVRAGQVDRAVEQFARIADSLSEEGFLQKASAIYKKVLKLRPEHEHALLRAAEIAASLGLFVDARAYLTQIIDRRQGRGDKRGAAQARVRLGALDPADFDRRIGAARARVELGDVAGATRDLKEIAAQLLEKGRPAPAIEALREAAVLTPDDDEIRQRLLDVFVASGDFARARECASTAEQLKGLAAALEAAGDEAAALETLSDAVRLEPGDSESRARLARAFVARGDLQAAAEYLTLETSGEDPQLLLTVAEIKLRGETPEDGLAIVRRLLDRYPDRREDVALLGWTIGEQVPEQGFSVVELAADAAVAGQDWASAAAALQEFVTRVPNYIPALMRLVEICVDGGLEATMYSAQADLADAYIAGGQAAEARFIAEDLVAREPWDRSNLERFRRVLELMGEPDPESLIAERLSGQSPFMTTDVFSESHEFPTITAHEPPTAGDTSVPPESEATQSSAAAPPLASSVELDAQPPAEPMPARTSVAKPADPFRVSAHAIDMASILGEFDAPAAAPAQEPADLDEIFATMRDDASRRSAVDEAEQLYRQALALREAADIDGCMAALEAASRAPKLRFVTSSLLARLYRARGMDQQAIEWFERAAQAPAPTAEEGHDLLYDLADALEQEGELARALAILLELQAEAGAYRDAAERIDRLTKVQARG